MIRALIASAARSIFQLAVLAACFAGFLFYVAYRLVKWAAAKDNRQPVRDAGFAVMVALVALGRALQTQALRRGDDEAH